MLKTNLILFQKRLVIILLFIFFVMSCAEQKCYTCKGYTGTLYQEASNVCGSDLLKYYQDIGWSCKEQSSTSSNPVSSITGTDENISSQANLTETKDSDCPCKKNKDNNNIDEAKDNDESL